MNWIFKVQLDYYLNIINFKRFGIFITKKELENIMILKMVIDNLLIIIPCNELITRNYLLNAIKSIESYISKLPDKKKKFAMKVKERKYELVYSPLEFIKHKKHTCMGVVHQKLIYDNKSDLYENFIKNLDNLKRGLRKIRYLMLIILTAIIVLKDLKILENRLDRYLLISGVLMIIILFVNILIMHIYEDCINNKFDKSISISFIKFKLISRLIEKNITYSPKIHYKKEEVEYIQYLETLLIKNNLGVKTTEGLAETYYKEVIVKYDKETLGYLLALDSD